MGDRADQADFPRAACHAPVSGEIVALNEELEATPELVNEKPYEVWLFKIKPNSEEALLAELKQLMGIDQYKASAGA